MNRVQKGTEWIVPVWIIKTKKHCLHNKRVTAQRISSVHVSFCSHRTFFYSTWVFFFVCYLGFQAFQLKFLAVYAVVVESGIAKTHHRFSAEFIWILFSVLHVTVCMSVCAGICQIFVAFCRSCLLLLFFFRWFFCSSSFLTMPATEHGKTIVFGRVAWEI